METIRATTARLWHITKGLIAKLHWVATRPGAIFRWLRKLRRDVWLIEGEERNSRLPLSILCAVAKAEEEAYLLKQIFADGYRRRRLGRYWLWRIAKAGMRSACSLVFVETTEAHLAFARLTDWFLIPAWLYGEVTLPRDAAATHKVSGDLRRVRRHGLRFQITRDKVKCRDFYDNMYLPYMKRTFGDCAELASRDRILQLLESSDLLLIENSEGTIAGQMLMHNGNESCLGMMGVRDGNREHVKAGAACALYQFGLQYLEDLGRAKAGLGWSRPFLRDGVLQFKRKWSQRITFSDPDGFALKILAPTPAARAFLVGNPFTFKRDGKLHGAVFIDDSFACDQAAKLLADYFHNGMESLNIYDRLGQHSLGPADVPAQPRPETVVAASR